MRGELLVTYFKRAENFVERLRLDSPLLARAPLAARFAHSREPVPFSRRLEGEFREIRPGDTWGGAWDSAWFHLRGQVPEAWNGGRVVARLNFNGEACVYGNDGCPLFGLTNGSVFAENYGKDIYRLPAAAGGEVELWVEAAASSLFGIRRSPDPDRSCPRRHGDYDGRVVAMELALFDEEVWGLWLDVEVLFSLLKALAPEFPGKENTDPWSKYPPLKDQPPRARRLLYGINRAIDAYADDRRNAAKARAVLAELFATPANASDMTVAAVGHAHIDTGWLWPVRESIRKCGRTFASQVALLEKYPDYVFGASQPQLYAFTREHYPALYEKIRHYVKSGRWELQGGMWVEADCNIISGESMVRQFVHGKNYFMDEFGLEVKNLWIPDVFGYSAAMPQIMKKAGVDFFLTQKLSWSQFNQFPHHTFRWRGLDGSEVVVHFPPEDTYNSEMLPQGQAKAQTAFREAHLLDEFMCLFGIGNGGGGPKEEHVERALRQAALEGAPKVRFSRADAFFDRLAARAGSLEVWSGELYLEVHRGTLTSQARTKKGNRLLERRLREVEFVCSALPAARYPAAELDRLWKTLLINQFHDILPGSSIRLVYDTAEAEYTEALAACDRLLASAMPGGDPETLTLVNTQARPFRGVVELPDAWAGAAVLDQAGAALPVHADAAGSAAAVEIPPCAALTLRRAGDNTAPAAPPVAGLVLENALVRYQFAADATLVSAFDKELGREMLTGPGNLLSLYVDRPVKYDAWEVDITYENELLETARAAAAPEPLGASAVRQGLKFILAIGESSITQTVWLNADTKLLEFRTSVDWRERHRMLRVAFPAAVQAQEAACDIQFGFAMRSTHRNTGWDMAKFEVPAHKYADISNRDFGVALLNDCKYGYKLTNGVLDLNLLRAPTHPDPDADQGLHSFSYALLPHRGDLASGGVIEAAEDFNFPPVRLPGGAAFNPPLAVAGTGVFVAALKQAEKGGSLILRLVESHGRHAVCELRIPDGAAANSCDLLEWHDGPALPPGEIRLEFTPFEIKTIRISGLPGRR